MKSYAKYSKQEKPNKTAVSIYSSFWRKNRDAWRETQRDGYREVERGVTRLLFKGRHSAKRATRAS